MRPRLAFALAPLFVACGAQAPSDAEIYYAAALRPGIELATTSEERLLLSRLGELPEGPTTLEGTRFELGAPYPAASGRVCRRVRTPGHERLACAARSDEHPRWTFVPDPFRATAGAETPAVPASYDGTAALAPSQAPTSEPDP